MLAEVGIDWHSYPDFFKSGTYAMKKHKRVEIPEELKSKKGNEGKEYFLRSYIDNFSLKRLRHQENAVNVLFSPVFEVHKESVTERNLRKID